MSNQTDPTRAALEALYFSFGHKDTGNPANRKGNQAKTDIITHNQDVRDALTLARNVIYNKHTPDKTTDAELLDALECVTDFMHAALSGTIHADADGLQHYEQIARAAIAKARGQ